MSDPLSEALGYIRAAERNVGHIMADEEDDSDVFGELEILASLLGDAREAIEEALADEC